MSKPRFITFEGIDVDRTNLVFPLGSEFNNSVFHEPEQVVVGEIFGFTGLGIFQCLNNQWTPVSKLTGYDSFRTVGLHRAVVAECVDVFTFLLIFLSHFNNSGCIFSESKNVTALGYQCFSGFPGFIRAVPRIGPFHMHFRIRINFLDTNGKCVHVAEELGNGECGNVTDLVGFCHCAGNQPVQIVNLVHVTHVGSHIG